MGLCLKSTGTTRIHTDLDISKIQELLHKYETLSILIYLQHIEAKVKNTMLNDEDSDARCLPYNGKVKLSLDLSSTTVISFLACKTRQ